MGLFALAVVLALAAGAARSTSAGAPATVRAGSLPVLPAGWAAGGAATDPQSQVAADTRCGANSVLLFSARGSGDQYGAPLAKNKIGAWTQGAGIELKSEGWNVRDLQAIYPAPPVPSFGDVAKAAAAGALVRGAPGAAAAVALIVKQFRDAASGSWQSVKSELEAAYSRCPSRRILLAGYSQGAILMRYIVPRLDAKIVRQVVSVDLFADPTEQRVVDSKLQHPPKLDGRLTTKGIDTLAGLLEHGGFFRQTTYPVNIEHRIFQYCVDGDLVCDASAANLDPSNAILEGKIHASYGFEYNGIQAGKRVGLFGGGSGATINAATVKLASHSFPRYLALAGDGSIWATESPGGGFGGLARIDPASGQITPYPVPGDSSTDGNIIRGPDGAIWFCGLEVVGRVDSTTGRITGWETPRRQDLGLPSVITLGPGGAIWYTSESVPATINRLTPSGYITRFTVPSGSGGLDMPGITMGPDGALWFTQSSVGSGPPPAIGRMSPTGRYSNYPLPSGTPAPTAITRGPDGALWFTTRTRIGRITTAGQIKMFSLPSGLSSFDIAAGRHGELWFTAGTRVGKITTSGKVRSWKVEGAKGLIGIIRASDGSLWMADGQADSVRHFRPTG